MRRYSIRNILGEVRIYTCNYIVGYIPSHTLRLWYYRNIMKFQIDEGASIHIGCKFGCTRYFSLGKNSTINQNCHLDNRSGLYIGENVSIAARCAFITADHLMDSPTFEGRGRKIWVDNFVFIGYGATVLGGVTLAEGSVIGARSLISKSTAEFSVYVGVPAKKVKDRSRNLNYTTNYRRLFH